MYTVQRSYKHRTDETNPQFLHILKLGSRHTSVLSLGRRRVDGPPRYREFVGIGVGLFKLNHTLT